MDQTCLVAGTGYTGLRLARELESRWRVVALARSEASAAGLAAARLEVLHVDLDGSVASSALAAAAEGAAIAYLVPPPEGADGDPRLVRFLDALAAVRPSVFLYI